MAAAIPLDTSHGQQEQDQREAEAAAEDTGPPVSQAATPMDERAQSERPLWVPQGRMSPMAPAWSVRAARTREDWLGEADDGRAEPETPVGPPAAGTARSLFGAQAESPAPVATTEMGMSADVDVDGAEGAAESSAEGSPGRSRTAAQEEWEDFHTKASIVAEMHRAALNDDLATLKSAIAALAQQAESLDTENAAGQTPLYTAAVSGNSRAARLLIEAGATVDAACPTTLFTPLQAAAKQGHAETVRLLLAAGADAAARNRRGKTARDLAQKKRHEAVVQLLDEACGEPGGAAPSEGIPPQRPPATAVYTTL